MVTGREGGVVRLPDFLGLGAQRAGTTLLYGLLSRHPQICMARGRKEVHFFDRYFDRGVRWYTSLFTGCGNKRCGEVTPAYLHDPLCPVRIRSLLPEVRLFVILRDPVERAYSQFKFEVRERGFKGSFEDFLRAFPDAISRGLYYQQLTRYYALFHRENILVLLFEDLIHRPDQEIRRLLDFLDVAPFPGPITLREKVNPGVIPRAHRLYVAGKRITAWLHDHDLSEIVMVLKGCGLSRFFFSRGGEASSFSPMEPRTRDQLREIFWDDVLALSRLLNRDLIALWGWNKGGA